MKRSAVRKRLWRGSVHAVHRIKLPRDQVCDNKDLCNLLKLFKDALDNGIDVAKPEKVVAFLAKRALEKREALDKLREGWARRQDWTSRVLVPQSEGWPTSEETSGGGGGSSSSSSSSSSSFSLVGECWSLLEDMQ